jgi:hypothetical protein
MGAQSAIFAYALPSGPAQAEPSSWRILPLVVLPAAVIGFALSLRIWNARPQPRPAAQPPAAAGGPSIPIGAPVADA